MHTCTQKYNIIHTYLHAYIRTETHKICSPHLCIYVYMYISHICTQPPPYSLNKFTHTIHTNRYERPSIIIAAFTYNIMHTDFIHDCMYLEGKSHDLRRSIIRCEHTLVRALLIHTHLVLNFLANPVYDRHACICL